MGMFDYVSCELPIPVGQDWEFQTKGTQKYCEMKRFVIRSDGRLIKCEFDTERTPDDEFPYKDHPNPLMRLYGSIRKVVGSDREEDQNFDGDLSFYAIPPDDDNGWLEYRATFRAGTCREICRSDDSGWTRVWEATDAR